jgi:hypothetical protein
MMAKMRMAKETSRPICIRGANALKMDFKTTCKPENDTVIIQCTKDHIFLNHIFRILSKQLVNLKIIQPLFSPPFANITKDRKILKITFFG